MTTEPQLRRRAVLVVAVVLQLAVLYWPRAAANPDGLPVDKLVHAFIFGFVAWAAVRAGLPLVWVIGLLVAHAVVSELIQGAFLPHRSGDPWDVVADTLGTCVGALWARQAMMSP